MTIWIIGRAVQLPNGHKYMAEPFLAFETNKDAQEACDLVQKLSGERPMITSTAIWRAGDRKPHLNAERSEPGSPVVILNEESGTGPNRASKRGG